MCAVMLLTSNPGRKANRHFSKVRNLPVIQRADNIEMDSLDGTLPPDEEEINTSTTKKCLNLNGLCKRGKDNYSEDLIFPENSIQSLIDLEAITLRSNDLHVFPMCLLSLTSLNSLDLSDNNLLTIPNEIHLLTRLQELILDHNLLSVLPTTLWDLNNFKVLRIAYNRLVLPPDKFADMRAFVLSDVENPPETPSKANLLTNLNLRANRLKGNIILGNYTNLVELDVSENNIEVLDLSAVQNLQVLQCSKNAISLLTLEGKVLTSLIAGNNKLRNFTVTTFPTALKHLDVSYNELDTLPEWLSGCQKLQSLFASNNNFRTLPEHLFCNDMPYLHAIQLACNQLQVFPNIQRKLPVQELFLQNNSLSHLPENFFVFLQQVKVLNVSNNRLCELPRTNDILQLEKLFLTANCLNDKSMEGIAPFLCNIKILHAAYNNFTSLPKNVASYWQDIEELVLSGNKLLRLPESIGSLKHLAVLRVHSNLLQTCPTLSKLGSLRVLDLAHNQLDKINLTLLIPPNLKFLDLSCNSQLHVDSQQFHTYRSQRPMSLVDVSGKNRTSLPLTPSPFCETDLTESSWCVGFSETAGSKQKLYISQIRLPAFCNTEGLFGMFDGENNNDLPLSIDKIVPRLLLEERTVKETASDYMKYTMLSVHRELREKGQRTGLNAVIVHILKCKNNVDYSFCGGYKRYVMKIASVGELRVVLGRVSGPMRLLPVKQRRQIRTNPQMQLIVPDPDITEVQLGDKDEFMIIANKNLWDVMTPENALKEVSLQRNVILAAKRLQDLAQSYGAEENLSVIVVKFNVISSDVDLLMRELRQTIRKNKYQSESGFSTASTCQAGCCCEALNNACTNCLDKIPLPPPMMSNDDRSSPSGQSDHACSDCNSSAKMFIQNMNKQSDSRSLRSVTPHYDTPDGKLERRGYRGVAKAVRQRKEEERSRDDSDSMSEEQFKCWEYMLEQNTQLLFDKELNTLSKGSRRNQLSGKNSLSRSSPHLGEIENNPGASFLSRQFGSTRSFNPLLTRPVSRFTPDKKQLLGGPHAAYFGSLQRLMPYNLEYDFAIMQERGLADSLDLDRMQQYWGVTTTEL